MFETLYWLSTQTLPMTVSDRRRIEELVRLDASGYARVHVPPLHVDCDDRVRQDPATVLGITPLGWMALSRGSGTVGRENCRYDASNRA